MAIWLRAREEFADNRFQLLYASHSSGSVCTFCMLLVWRNVLQCHSIFIFVCIIAVVRCRVSMYVPLM